MAESERVPIWVHLNLNPVLRRAALGLLPESCEPWDTTELAACWDVSLSTANRWRWELLQLDILVEEADGRTAMSDSAREDLLWMLVDKGEHEEARHILRGWLLRHAQLRQRLRTAWVFDMIADLEFLRGDTSYVIRSLRCSIALRRTSGDLQGETTRSWTLGAYLARHGRRAEAIDYIRRATILAELLRLEQAPSYRRRLNELLSEQ